MSTHSRPLSPHLQVYRLPITGLISITHRMTGVFLAFGLMLFVVALAAVALGEHAYAAMQQFMQFWLWQLAFWGFIYALFFHLCHGVRHLLWDMGDTFAKKTFVLYALVELAAAGGLTALTFILFRG